MKTEATIRNLGSSLSALLIILVIAIPVFAAPFTEVPMWNQATGPVGITSPAAAPVAVDDGPYAATEDQSLQVLAADGVLDNDTDSDSDELTAVKVTDPGKGTVTLNPDGSFDYMPANNLNGLDSFTYQAYDGTENSNTAKVDINISTTNDAPTAGNDGPYSTNDNQQLVVTAPGVLDNDNDIDGDELTAIIETEPAKGSVTLNANGSFTYIPNLNADGSDSFTYKANDGTADSNIATVTINVTDVNQTPVAVNDPSYTTPENQQLVVILPGVLGNDTDGDGDDLTASKVTDPTKGSVILNANGSFTYTPNANANGPDSFTYKANDGTADSNIATVTINITDVNQAPVAVNDPSYSTNEDQQLVINAPGVLGNDTDSDGDELTAVKVTNPTKGSITLNANGSFTYNPNQNANGPDSFTYKANDGQADSNIATVTVNIIALNDAPVAKNLSIETNENTAKAVVLEATDVDNPPNPLTYVIVNQPQHGTLSGTGANRTYTPAANYDGPDSFTYKANDGSADSNVATVTITVKNVNNKPTLDPVPVSTDEGTTYTFTLANFSNAFKDPIDGDTLVQIRIESLPSNGSLRLNNVEISNAQLPKLVTAAQLQAGALKYVPPAFWSGLDSFNWNATDGKDFAQTGSTVSVTVNAVNDPPTIVDINKDGPENLPILFSKQDFVNAYDDVELSPLKKVQIVSLPENGTLTAGVVPIAIGDEIEANSLGDLVYTPDPSFFGSDSFEWKGYDGGLYSNVANVNLTITPSNDPPVLDLDAQSGGSDFNATYITIDGPEFITSRNLTITDDGPNLTSATVKILNLVHGAQEILDWDKTIAGIVGNYSISGTIGTLQFNGSAPIADYIKILESIEYHIDPSVANPSTTTRQIQVDVYDGEASSNDAFAAIAVIHPSIEITVTPDNQSIPKGGTASFSVKIENTGSIDLKDVTVSTKDNSVTSCNRAYATLPADGTGSTKTFTCLKSGVTSPFEVEFNVEATLTGPAGNSKVSDKDTALVRVPEFISVDIAPVANVGDVIIKGQDAKFNILVVNPSNTANLTDVKVKAFIDEELAMNVAGVLEEVPAPACDKTIGELKKGSQTQYTCTIPNVQTAFQIKVVATGLIDGLPPETTDLDIHTITVLSLTLEVAASPFQVPSGATTPVEFSLTLANASSVPLTLTQLNSNVHGNLFNPNNPAVGDNSCATVAKDIPAGEVRACSYTVQLSAPPPALTNIITATAKDSSNKTISTEDTAIVSIGDFSPLEVNLSAAPDSLVAPGGTVNLTVRVTNNTNSEVTLDELTESKAGNLNGKGTCQVPREIPATSEYSCVYTVTISGKKPGDIETRTIVAKADSQEATDAVDIPITATPPTTILLPVIPSKVLAGEPNNNACSHLPLVKNMNHFFYADDSNDWYSFWLDETSDVRIRLSNFMVTEGQLIVYGGSCSSPGSPIGHNGERGVVPTREIVLDGLQGGKAYYVWVLSSQGLTSASPYTMRIVTTSQ